MAATRLANCLYLAWLLTLVAGDGFFEMRIEKFQLDENFPASKCCHQGGDVADQSFTACLAKCQFLIRVCLDRYQTVWNADRLPECPMGSKTVPLPLTQLKKPLATIDFLVPSRWQENFTLILDVLHDVGESAPPKLIFRLPSNEVNVTSYHHWKVKSFGSRSFPSYAQPQSQTAPAQRGIGLSVLTTFIFKCAPGFFGPLCEDECNQHGNQPGAAAECESEQPQCPQGYTGRHCDIPICSQGCQNGDCVDPNTCRCHQGWIGDDCSTCQVYPGCKHGACLVDAGTNRQLPFTCACSDGWGGMLCDIDLQFCQNNKGVCKNHGKCENVRNANGQSYRCVCAPGFRGDHCEMRQLDCLSSGCRNGGQCTQHLDGQSRCICPKGYYGNLCEFNQTVCSEHPCQATNSVCHPLPKATNGRQFYCTCPPGYTGDNCEINIDDCASKPCQNGAFCEDLISSYRCICPSGFSGIWCEKHETECPPKLCPQGSSCFKTEGGAFKCSPINAATPQKLTSPLVANVTPSTPTDAVSTEKSNVVMVHLQPSFLTLTVGIPVAVALSGLVLAIAVCLFMVACVWRREKNRSKGKPPPQSFFPKLSLEDDVNGYGSETSTIWSAYEPLNPTRSKDTGLPKLSLYPKFKVNDRAKPSEPSLYDQKRYSEAPGGRPYSIHVSPTLTYEQPGGYDETRVPTLPPRPAKAGPLVTYSSTLLRPFFYPLTPQTLFSGQRFLNPPPEVSYADLSNGMKRHKDTIVYTLLRPNKMHQSFYTDPSSGKQPSNSGGNGADKTTCGRQHSNHPHLALIETKRVGDFQNSRGHKKDFSLPALI
uniref:Delta-like protein n=1 Tax=Mesocestoides corti TaxID=53468 RepID=A0A5K3F9X4_MESCO